MKKISLVRWHNTELKKIYMVKMKKDCFNEATNNWGNK